MSIELRTIYRDFKLTCIVAPDKTKERYIFPIFIGVTHHLMMTILPTVIVCMTV